MPNPTVLSRSRDLPVPVEHAFHTTLPMPLPQLFRRWYGPIPPIRSADPDDCGPWERAGQTRTVVQAGGGTMREELTVVDAPGRFDYHVSDLRGPLAALIEGIDGMWEFTPAGTGSSVTWTWRVSPTRAGAVLMPVIGRLWNGYARNALDDLADYLLAAHTAS